MFPSLTPHALTFLSMLVSCSGLWASCVSSDGEAETERVTSFDVKCQGKVNGQEWARNGDKCKLQFSFSQNPPFFSFMHFIKYKFPSQSEIINREVALNPYEKSKSCYIKMSKFLTCSGDYKSFIRELFDTTEMNKCSK